MLKAREGARILANPILCLLGEDKVAPRHLRQRRPGSAIVRQEGYVGSRSCILAQAKAPQSGMLLGSRHLCAHVMWRNGISDCFPDLYHRVYIMFQGALSW